MWPFVKEKGEMFAPTFGLERFQCSNVGWVDLKGTLNAKK